MNLSPLLYPAHTYDGQDPLAAYHFTEVNEDGRLAQNEGEEVEGLQSSEEDNADEDMSGLHASDQGDPSDEDHFRLEDSYEERNSEFDELAEWPWIKAVDVFTELEGEKIGSCHGKIIDREPIGAIFYQPLEKLKAEYI